MGCHPDAPPFAHPQGIPRPRPGRAQGAPRPRAVGERQGARRRLRGSGRRRHDGPLLREHGRAPPGRPPPPRPDPRPDPHGRTPPAQRRRGRHRALELSPHPGSLGRTGGARRGQRRHPQTGQPDAPHRPRRAQPAGPRRPGPPALPSGHGQGSRARTAPRRSLRLPDVHWIIGHRSPGGEPGRRPARGRLRRTRRKESSHRLPGRQPRPGGAGRAQGVLLEFGPAVRVRRTRLRPRKGVGPLRPRLRAGGRKTARGPHDGLGGGHGAAHRPRAPGQGRRPRPRRPRQGRPPPRGRPRGRPSRPGGLRPHDPGRGHRGHGRVRRGDVRPRRRRLSGLRRGRSRAPGERHRLRAQRVRLDPRRAARRANRQEDPRGDRQRQRRIRRRVGVVGRAHGRDEGLRARTPARGGGHPEVHGGPDDRRAAPGQPPGPARDGAGGVGAGPRLLPRGPQAASRDSTGRRRTWPSSVRRRHRSAAPSSS